MKERNDIAELLRANANEPWMTIGGKPFALEAAAEIERLRAALGEIAALRGEDLYYGPDANGVDNTAAAQARAALGIAE